MSDVTNCIFSFSCMEEDVEDVDENHTFPIMDKVNEFFEYEIHVKARGFVSVSSPELPRHWYGGTKHLETPVYMAAFNGFDIEGFMNHIQKLDWKEPENVQLLIQRQEDDKFTILLVT